MALKSGRKGVHKSQVNHYGKIISENEITIDENLTPTSTNPVQAKAIWFYMNKLATEVSNVTSYLINLSNTVGKKQNVITYDTLYQSSDVSLVSYPSTVLVEMPFDTWASQYKYIIVHYIIKRTSTGDCYRDSVVLDTNANLAQSIIHDTIKCQLHTPVESQTISDATHYVSTVRQVRFSGNSDQTKVYLQITESGSYDHTAGTFTTSLLNDRCVPYLITGVKIPSN